MVGGEEAYAAHPWEMWKNNTFFTTPRSSSSGWEQLAKPKMELEANVEKLFFEESIADQTDELWRLSQVEERYGMAGVEQDEVAPAGVQ